MNNNIPFTLIVAVAVTLASGDLLAQEQKQLPVQSQEAPQAASKKAGVPLRVQVVISRHQGDKKISSVPYTLSVHAVAPPFKGSPSQLKMGSRVPIVSAAPGPSTDKPSDAAATAFRSYSYQDIGTQIDCSATAMDDGRFELTIAIDDSSIYVDDQVVKGVSKGSEPPIFRQFRSGNHLILRDGQTTQFTAATDRINGEVISVEVTLNVTN